MNYNKNELINTTLDKYYETFSHMLDTSDYVPEKFNDKIGKYIFKNLKKTFKLIDGEDRKYQRKFKKEIKKQEKEKKLEERKLSKENKPKKVRFKMFKKIGHIDRFFCLSMFYNILEFIFMRISYEY